MEQVLFGGSFFLLSPTVTQYESLSGGAGWSPTEYWSHQLVSTDGVIKQLRVTLWDAAGNPASPGAGNKYEFTLIRNGNPTALTFEIADAATSGSNMVDEINVSGGVTLSIRCVPTSSPTAVYAAWSSVFEGDTENESLILGGAGGEDLNKGKVEYGQVMTGYTRFSTTEDDFRQVVPTSGTIKNFYVKTYGHAGTPPEAYRYTLRKGPSGGPQANTALTVTLTAPAQAGSDLVHTVDVVAGDVLTMMFEPLNRPGGTPDPNWGFTFVADIDGESITMGGSNIALDNSDTEYNRLTSTEEATWRPAEPSRYALGQVCTLKKLHVLLNGSPGAGNDYDFAIRIDGTNIITLQISDAEITGDSGLLEDTVALDEYVNLRCIPTSSPTAREAYWGLVCFILPAPPSQARDFPCEFVVRQPGSQDLAASFDGQVSLNLPAEFVARRDGSQEFLAIFNVGGAESVELRGELIVRQAGSQDLAASFDGQDRDDVCRVWIACLEKCR